MSQYLEHPAETDKANEFTVEQLFDDGISFGSTATIQALSANLDGAGSLTYSDVTHFSAGGGRLRHNTLGLQTRLVNSCPNLPGRTAAYWFGLDSAQIGAGMVYEADTLRLVICTGSFDFNSDDYVPNITLGETTQGSGVPTLGVLGHSPVARQPGGAATASGSYGATEQGMIQKVYDAMRAFGFLT